MDDERNMPSVPARSKFKIYKYLVLSLYIIVLFGLIGYTGVEATSSSKFCSSCHAMKPEYYTWQASSHSQIDCTECHISDGITGYAKAKANGLKEVYISATNSYTAPVQMPSDIPNEACEKCHNMKALKISAPGDLIIPHDKHLAMDIQCVQCHSGVAHGNISDRNITFKSDYNKWDAALGKQMMGDVKFTRTTMETCEDCHKARNVSTACTTCHSTGMKPATHSDPNFMNGLHGKLALKDILKCNSCHQYTTDQPIPDLQTQSASKQFLTNTSAKGSTISASVYAKENTFCLNCHSTKRPVNHISGWINKHGPIANKDQQQCLVCHSDKKVIGSITSNGAISNAVPVATSGSAPACTNCHPALHDGRDYKSNHPIDLTGITKPSASCYACHSKSACTSCHKDD